MRFKEILITVALTISQIGIMLFFKLDTATAFQIISLFFALNWIAVYTIGKLHLQKSVGLEVQPQRLNAEKSLEAGKTLQIAQETLPFLRQGLNPTTATKTAEIIKKISDVAAVAVTDQEKVLAFIGAGCDNHRPGDDILTEATKRALATGKMQIIRNQRQLDCPRKDCRCPLEGAVIVPLKCRSEVVGTLKLYEAVGGDPPEYIIKLADGIGQLLNLQIELAELDRQTQLATIAELDALRAQINPHFLFNTLNTIIMYSRVEPAKAREMLIKLSNFFRLALKKPGHLHTFADELKFVKNYLYLEQHRFKDRLTVEYRVNPETLELPFPVLTLQPLVENAIRHGLSPKVGSGHLIITATVDGDIFKVEVSDNGVGMDELTRIQALVSGKGSGFGVGLSNVYERLKRLYDQDLVFAIISEPEQGTTVSIAFPWRKAQFIGEIQHDFTRLDS